MEAIKPGTYSIGASQTFIVLPAGSDGRCLMEIGPNPIPDNPTDQACTEWTPPQAGNALNAPIPPYTASESAQWQAQAEKEIREMSRKAQLERTGKPLSGFSFKQGVGDPCNGPIKPPLDCTSTPTSIDQTLSERGSRYGAFEDNSVLSQDLKSIIAHTPGSDRLRKSQQEALDLIFTKISRIINGDSDYADNWVDIAGYAKLVADELEAAQ
jgi:hypothetical protein